MNTLSNRATAYLKDLVNLFYPNLCLACERSLHPNEKVLCLRCENELPLTEFWEDRENPLAKRFWGRVPMEEAVSLYRFHKGGPVQHLLHQLKYKGRKEIGEYCGQRLGHFLKSKGDVFEGIDLIIPVPLHWKKQRLRGYNQCEPFAKGLSQTLAIPYSRKGLKRVHENISQTQKHRYDRWENVAEIFAVEDNEVLAGKHILLVDDVVTTGATAEACMQVILSVSDTKVSFASIAVAEYT